MHNYFFSFSQKISLIALASRSYGACAMVAVATLAINCTARAATDTWTGADAITGALWSSGTNWTSIPNPPNPSDPLVFTGALQTTNTNDFAVNTQFNGISFDALATSPFVLTGNAINMGGDLINSSTATHTVNLSLALQQNTNLNASGALVVGGTISGGFAVTKLGGGTVTLNAINTFTGGLTLNAGGGVVVGNDLALGTGTTTLNGGALIMRNATTTLTTNFVLNVLTTGTIIQPNNQNANIGNAGAILGSGTLVLAVTNAGASALITFGNSTANALSAFTGTLAFGPTDIGNFRLGSGGSGGSFGNTTFTFDTGSGGGKTSFRNSGATLTMGALLGSGTLTGAANGHYIVGGNNTSTTFAGSILGSNTLEKTGTASLTLSGTNPYSGTTTVTSGTLTLTGFLTGNSAVTVAAPATLSGTGSSAGTLTVNGSVSSGLLSGSLSAVGLKIGNSVTFNNGSNLTVNLDDTGNTSSFLAITGGLSLIGSDTLTLNLLNTTPTTNAFLIATFTGPLSGTFTTVNNLPVGYAVQYNANNITVAPAAVPEPGTWAMLFGGVGVLIASRRFRRRA